MHHEIGHFGETRTLSEIKQQFFWHDKTNFVKEFVKACDKCQLAKDTNNLKYNVEGMKSILVCDLFYHVTLSTTGPVLETSTSNKYVFVVIDHYSKWCEACIVEKHNVAITVRFLEKEIICNFGVPKYIFIDNGIEWMK
jgi:hypothetical protein